MSIYGDCYCYRNDGTTTTSFVGWVVNRVMSNRFMTAQQIGRSQRGAYLLLQICIQAIKKKLRVRFQHGSPGIADEYASPLDE